MLAHLAHPTRYSELHFGFELADRLGNNIASLCLEHRGHLGNNAGAASWAAPDFVPRSAWPMSGRSREPSWLSETGRNLPPT